MSIFAPWPYRISLRKEDVDIIEDLTLVYEYRYRWSDSEIYLQSWSIYDPGSVNLFVANDTSGTRTLIIETRVLGYLGTHDLYYTNSESHEIIIEPTPVFSFQNWDISEVEQVSGSWSWSVDISSSPSYGGTDNFEIDIDAEFKTDGGSTVATSAWDFTALSDTVSGSFTLPSFTSSVSGAHGSFVFDSNLNITNSTAINVPVTSSKTWDDLWESVYVESTRDGSTCENAYLWDGIDPLSLGDTWYYDSTVDAWGIWVEVDIDGDEFLVKASGEDTYIHRVLSGCSTSVISDYDFTDDRCSYMASLADIYSEPATITMFVGDYSGDDEGYEIIMENITSSGCP